MTKLRNVLLLAAAALAALAALWPVRAESAAAGWALRPLAKPTVPVVASDDWSKTPIDSFILKKLAENGMRPSPPAAKPVLLRRVYYNLIGLPPTPEELKRFVSDESPGAFTKVVDRLLERPEYGERWARHWLDVAHYAESHGHDQDRIRTNAWPYRDYVIESFNADKSYSRFVQEQIAGDALFPHDPAATVAMGFLATGPWDESSLRDIREETFDRQIARYVDRDDIISTVMNTFISTTVQCARCHDHKFDPVPQMDYYKLQAVFAGTEKGNRYFDDDPATHQQRQHLLARKEQIEALEPEARAELTGEAFQTKLREWENRVREETVLWTVLAPASVTNTASNGVTLTIRADNSVFSAKERPDKETYIVYANTPEESKAIRLETLREESISLKGPGRADNGNFHLTGFRVFAVADDGSEQPVPIESAIADFNQEGWDVRQAIDDDPKTGWGVYPAIGQTHAAVFTLVRSVPAGTRLKFVLEQNHGGGHLIKRLRLSTTLSEPPPAIHIFPEEIARTLLVSTKARSDKQKIDLARFLALRWNEEEIKTLPEPRVVYAGARNFIPDGQHKPGRTARPVHFLRRGDIHKAGERVGPGAPGLFPELAGEFPLKEDCAEAERRIALARWITDPRNALTWRSIVNRVWHYHFGRGIVATPNDFGAMGARPSHPELLEWLARWFLENGGHFKELHRLILKSAVYQQASSGNAEYESRDADNLLLWRMNRARMDAESMRDTILTISGKLVNRMGGPSDQHFLLKPGIHVTPEAEYAGFDVDSAAAQRRSVYRFVFRTLPDPLMDVLDCPDSSQLTPVRNSSVTAGQALALWNDKFVLRYSEHFANRLRELAPESLEDQVRLAVRLALCREPKDHELQQLTGFAREHELASLCRVLINSNEFVFVH